jgi:hypothetical protein
MRLPRVKSVHRPFTQPNNRIIIGLMQYGVASEIEDDEHGSIARLLTLMDGTRDMDAICADLAATHPDLDAGSVREVIGQLIDEGFIEDASAPLPDGLAEADAVRYEPARHFFAWIDTTARRSPYEIQARISPSRVGLLGLGGTGTAVAASLVASGIGSLHCADFDVVEQANLTRQLPYAESDIGQPKVKAALDRLRAMSSRVTVTGEECRVSSAEDVQRLMAGWRISFATRLHHLVLQTDVTAIWAVPRRYRYRVYLSGMLCDLAVICTAILLTAHTSLPPLADRLLGALIVVLAAAMVLQAQLFMRTDLYFVLLDVLRCRNLFHDGLAYTRYLLRRLGHAIAPARIAVTPDPSADLPAPERRAVRVYAAAVVTGSTIALGSFALYGLPILIHAIATALTAVSNGIKGGNALAAIDATLIILVEGTLQTIFLITFYRRHRHRLQRWRRPDRSAK